MTRSGSSVVWADASTHHHYLLPIHDSRRAIVGIRNCRAAEQQTRFYQLPPRRAGFTAAAVGLGP